MYATKYDHCELRSFIRWIIILIGSFILFTNTTVTAVEILEDDVFYPLPNLFIQKEWVESKNTAVVYLLNFREIDREVVESNFFQPYFSDKSVSEGSWQYSDQEGLIEIKNLYKKSNSLIISDIKSVFTEGKNSISWLTAYEDNISKIRLRERYIGLDRVKQAGDDRLLEISLIPKNVSYEKKEILTEVSLYYGTKSKVNKVETTARVGNSHLDTIALISNKINKKDGERRRYFALQLAAVVVPVEELLSNNGSFLAVGDLSGINEIFDNMYIYNIVEKVSRNIISIGLGNKGEQLIFNHFQGRNKYLLELSRSPEYGGIYYLINTDLSLIEDEDIFLSFRVSNENNILNYKSRQELFDNNDDLYKPVIRIGLVDQVKWGDEFVIGLSYYPINMTAEDDESPFTYKLWQLSALYNHKPWSFQYKGEFIKNRKRQEISLRYLLERERSISFTYGFNYGDKAFFSFAYSFSLG